MWKEWLNPPHEPRAGVPSLSSPWWVGLGGKPRGNSQLEKWCLLPSFLGFFSMLPPPPGPPIGPVKEGSMLLYVYSLPSPSFHGCPLGTSQQLPIADHLTTWNLG